jgi:hypothetical protein
MISKFYWCTKSSFLPMRDKVVDPSQITFDHISEGDKSIRKMEILFIACYYLFLQPGMHGSSMLGQEILLKSGQRIGLYV